MSTNIIMAWRHERIGTTLAWTKHERLTGRNEARKRLRTWMHELSDVCNHFLFCLSNVVLVIWAWWWMKFDMVLVVWNRWRHYHLAILTNELFVKYYAFTGWLAKGIMLLLLSQLVHEVLKRVIALIRARYVRLES